MSQITNHAMGEQHLVHRTGWLRATVLGGNDGIIPVFSLIVGVAAAPGAPAGAVLVAGIAKLVGGALSPRAWVLYLTPATALVLLAVLGALGARAGGALVGRGMMRVVLLGALAMGVTALIGTLAGTVV